MEASNILPGSQVILSVPNFYWKRKSSGLIDVLFPKSPEELYDSIDEWNNLPSVTGSLLGEKTSTKESVISKNNPKEKPGDKIIKMYIPKNVFLPEDTSKEYFTIFFPENQVTNITTIKSSDTPTQILLGNIPLN